MKRSKKSILLVSAFLIPILIVCIHLIYMQITHTGYFNKGENLLLADMSSQYNSLYSYVQDAYLGNESFFYSFSKSIGGNMASTIGYYLGSPLNFLYVFFPKTSIPLCTFIIYLIKIGLCGLFMNFFLTCRLRRNTWSMLMFSTAYALCSYTVNYYFNNMWLDVVLLAPLVMYGINYIIEKKRIYLYTIFLSIAIISNFYIAYMLCIFCVIYFLFEIITRYQIKKDYIEIRNISLKFILGSLLAGGISCILLLPAITNLSQIMRFQTDPSQLKYDMRGLKNTVFNDFFSKLYIGSHSKESSLSRNRPNIYFGIFSLILCYYYFFNHKIKIKEKIMTALIMVLFCLSFYVPYMNIFWHAFSFPNGYICRFSFLFIFFMIFVASKEFINLDKIKIVPSIAFLIIYIAIALYINNQYLVFLEQKDLILSCFFAVLYIVLLIILSRTKERKYLFTYLIIIAVMIEIFINFSDCLVTNNEMKIVSSYKNFYNDICTKINNLDDDFYRVDGNYYYSYLDSMICDTNSVTSSLSTNDGNLYHAFYDYGMALTYTTITADANKLPIMDSIMGVKYFYSKEPFDSTLYNLKKSIFTKRFNYVYKEWRDKEVYLYENPYALNLGFLVSSNAKKTFKKGSFSNRFEYLNSLMKSLTGNDKDVLHAYKGEYLGNNKYKFTIDNNVDNLYLSYDYDISINWTSYESVYINEEYIMTGNSDDIGIIKIPNKYANQDIIVRVGYDNYSYEESNVDSLVIYWLDLEQFEEDINILKKHQMSNIKAEKNVVEGKVDVTSDNNILFLSIPYDKGWNVYVDGKKTDYFKMANGFTGIRLSEGKHTIKMKYYSPNFFLGLVISICSVGLLIVYEIHNKKKLQKNGINSDKEIAKV